MSMSDNKLSALNLLNAILAGKLTAINQFFLHARILKHRGLLELADYAYRASIGAMKNSDMLVEFMLARGGMPNMQDTRALNIGETPAQMVGCDLALAEHTLLQLSHARDFAHNANDTALAALVERISLQQQENVEQLRTLLANITSLTTPTVKDCA